MDVAQLFEQSLPAPEVRGSNPVIGDFLLIDSLIAVLKRRTQRKKAGHDPFKKDTKVGTYRRIK